MVYNIDDDASEWDGPNLPTRGAVTPTPPEDDASRAAAKWLRSRLVDDLATYAFSGQAVTSLATLLRSFHEKGRVEALGWDEDDGPLPEDEHIRAAHPMRTGRHDLYGKAMRLVGAKRSKGALVDLVNWILSRAWDAERRGYERGLDDAEHAFNESWGSHDALRRLRALRERAGGGG